MVPGPAGARFDIAPILVGVVAAAVGAVVVGTAIRMGAEADFQVHVALTIAGLEGAPFPGNALFYWLDAGLAGFRPDERRLFGGMTVILALAIGAKMYLTASFVGAQHRTQAGRQLPVHGAVLAGLCLFAFGLPIGLRYLAFIPPNVWHNSTTVLLMPLAFGLFWASLTYLRAPSTRLLWLMLVLVVLNVLAKPSFLFCWLVVFPVAVVLRERRASRIAGPALVWGAGAALVAAQYVYIYLIGRGDPSTEDSGVGVAPLHVWSAYTDHPEVGFLAGYAFPIVALMVGGPAVRRGPGVRFASGLAVVGLLWFATLTETGVREFHGNFMWQAIVTNYLLFVTVLSAVLPWLRASRFGWRQVIVLGVFALHIIGGAQFLLHWLGGHTTWNA